MKNFGSTLRDQTGLALSNCNARIELELTPEQKIKFAEIEKEQQAFVRSRFNGEAAAKKSRNKSPFRVVIMQQQTNKTTKHKKKL